MQAVIFDMDGVLIDSEPLHYQAEQQLLKQLNIKTSRNYLNQFVGTTSAFMWSQILTAYHRNEALQDVLAQQLEIKINLLQESEYQPIQGVIELLDKLKRTNLRMAVASSSAPQFIEAVLTKLKLINYFEFSLSGENVPQGKPAPDIFLKAAELLQLQASQCVVIEDSMHGVSAAKSAGMRCIGYQNPNSGQQNLSQADIVINCFDELDLSLFKQW